MNNIALVMAREPIPASGPSVFLAGPTPRLGGDVASWRPAAVEALAVQWSGTKPLTVLSPESRDGQLAEHYDDQVDWETEARARASAILFWVPRDLATMPGFTTNVEFGLDVATGRAVLGCPADCPNPERNRYLIYVARRHGVPVRHTLADTAAAALAIVTAAEDAHALIGTPAHARRRLAAQTDRETLSRDDVVQALVNLMDRSGWMRLELCRARGSRQFTGYCVDSSGNHLHVADLL